MKGLKEIPTPVFATIICVGVLFLGFVLYKAVAGPPKLPGPPPPPKGAKIPAYILNGMSPAQRQQVQSEMNKN